MHQDYTKAAMGWRSQARRSASERRQAIAGDGRGRRFRRAPWQRADEAL